MALRSSIDQIRVKKHGVFHTLNGKNDVKDKHKIYGAMNPVNVKTFVRLPFFEDRKLQEMMVGLFSNMG